MLRRRSAQDSDLNKIDAKIVRKSAVVTWVDAHDPLSGTTGDYKIIETLGPFDYHRGQIL